VSRQTFIQTTLARPSQSRREARLLLVLAAPHLETCISPSTPSPKDRFFARQGTEDDGERTAWFIHSLLLQRDRWQASTSGSTVVWLHRHPERHASLQASVSMERHLSRIFPARPRSLALVPIPRPAARRVSASATPPYGLRLSENLCSKDKNAKRFPEPSVKAPLGTWERGTSRRFAQECPEGNPGKYKQGETQWHSTKTTSN
jgi:hypothetical protein